VIGQGDRGHAELDRFAYQPVDGDRAVKDRVIGMIMKMDKFHYLFIHFKGHNFKQFLPNSPAFYRFQVIH